MTGGATLPGGSEDVVQVGATDLTEGLERIGFHALGQGVFRKPAELDTRLERDLEYRPKHRFRSVDHFRRGKEPHSVDEPDQVLLIAAKGDVVMDIRVQEQLDALITKSA